MDITPEEHCDKHDLNFVAGDYCPECLKVPEGATHRHEGNGNYLPHYIKVEDKVYTWVTGFVFNDCWSSIQAHDDLANYKPIEAPEIPGFEGTHDSLDQLTIIKQG